MAVTFESMIRKSMRMYWLKTSEYDELSSNKTRKYNKKYFDGMEEEFLGPKDKSKEAVKKVK